MQSEDGRLSPSSEERVKLVYKGFVRSKGGPYMKAVYCLLARCDVSNNHPEVCVKTEDYMWLKVNFRTLHIYCIAGNFFCMAVCLCNRQIEICQYFVLVYIHVHVVIPYRTAKFMTILQWQFGAQLLNLIFPAIR